MAVRLADRLSAARHRRFVGREGERALFRAALAAPELPFLVLHVFGPGGVGKSTLLAELAHMCSQVGVPATLIDGRHVEATPESFTHALQSALALPEGASPLEYLAQERRRHVVLIDTYETLAALDGWLRDMFLPEAPDQTLFVLAGREPPSVGWRADPGWQSLLHVVPLRNLSPEESRTFLAHWDIPASDYQSLLDFTHGHPLALSLVADVFAQRGEFRFDPQAVPDVVRSLLQQFVQKVPGPAHRTALEACALVRLTSEPLLADLLATPDSSELFEWLRGLSFVEMSAEGIFPHDLAREALAADLRWRNPDMYAELHRRARLHYQARLQQARREDQPRILIDLIYLHRDNPVVRPFFDVLRRGPGVNQEASSVVADGLLESDVATLVKMVERHEGKESAELARYWLGRQPHGCLVLRDSQQPPAGMLMMVGLQEVTTEDQTRDPAVAAAARYLARHGPLRAAEVATIFRFWMGDDSYQSVSPMQSLIFVHMVRHYLTTPGLAFTFLPAAEPDFWSPMFAYADLSRLAEADFEVGGRRYGVYGHDWRAVPPVAWLELLAEREVATSPPTTPSDQPAIEPLLVLSQPDFVSAVRDALRDFTRPDALRSNPLLRSRLVLERTGPGASAADRTAALQAAVREVVEALLASPRDAKLSRALERTYIRPAATQEQAAEILDLPFSTYRRHLTSGVSRIADILWQRELESHAS